MAVALHSCNGPTGIKFIIKIDNTCMPARIFRKFWIDLLVIE